MITSRPCLAIWSSACGLLLAWTSGILSESWAMAVLVMTAVLLPALAFGASRHLRSHVAIAALSALLLIAVSFVTDTPALGMSLVLIPISAAVYVNWYANSPAPLQSSPRG